MRNNIIFISISLGLIILLGIGFSYSLWNISVSQDTTNLAESKCFDLSITNQENNINLDSTYPISNDKGKSLTPYTFTITNTCDITTEYSVNLEVLNNSTLASKFIDVMFEGNINLLSSYENTDKVNTSSIESRKLTTGILKSKESKDYSLRLWIDYNTTLEDLNNEIKSFKSKIVVVGKPINYTGDTVFNFDYTGSEQTFIAPVSGTYKLETWGSQGGNTNTDFGGITTSRIGGSGGYSVGYFKLRISKLLFLNIGQGGKSTPVDSSGSSTKCFSNSTFNGGGSAYIYNCVDSAGSGGGATHIATKSGQLNTLEKYKEQILIVSGGGGGSYAYPEFAANGGSGGGFKGELPSDITSDGICGRGRSLTLGSKASQKSGGSTSGCEVNNSIDAMFGFGESTVISKYEGGPNNGDDSYGSGGGGGFYGGGAGRTAYGAGGGSGYIGNPLLTNKVMYCYNCEESNEESTKTISTTCNEETPTSYCAKKGNGYARITLVSIDE